MKPVLIVLSAGQREYRGSMLARIADEYRLVLVSPEPVTWEREHVVDHVTVDPADPAGFVTAGLAFAARYPVCGVFTHDEWCIEMAAAIGKALGVPQCDPVAAVRCRDKWASREALRLAGVPSARSELTSSVSEALRAAERIGYPVVIKPRAMSASFGVALVQGPGEVAAAFERALAAAPKRAWRHEDGVLVEEYLDGDEISVDSTVTGGRTDSVVFTRKVLGYPPHFEEIGHIVAAPERILPDPGGVRDLVRAAHEALGIDDTVTHTEIRLTARGPRIVEVNGRLGGGLIPELALQATGADIALASARIAAGHPAGLARTRDTVAGIRFFYADEDGVVESRALDPDLAAQPWVRRVQWLVEPGATIRPLPGRRYFARAGFAIVVADSVERCRERMEEAAARVTIATTPLTAAGVSG